MALVAGDGVDHGPGGTFALQNLATRDTPTVRHIAFVALRAAVLHVRAAHGIRQRAAADVRATFRAWIQDKISVHSFFIFETNACLR